MGADSWSEIQTWKDWQRLLTMTNHIVVTRPGYEIQTTGIDDEVQNRIVVARKSPRQAVSASNKRIFFSDAVQLDISATDIREAARADRFDQLLRLVPESVANYISKYGLYRETNES
jgi:nicotinate-nucleotide adenylyltransferase